MQDSLPKFPFPEGPRDYQKKALDAWIENKYKGFFAMATGTGKTITSLNCLLHLYREEGSYKCLILVPTISLVDQWKKECTRFGFRNIIKISSKERGWKDAVMRIVTNSYFNVKNISYVIIATYASFAKSETCSRIEELPASTLLIADEAHNMGSTLMLKAMKRVVFQRRIGLSATPHRQYDPQGNRSINDFFGIKDHYAFEYSMAEAIEKGVLCKYRYFPHVVNLNEDEMEQYLILSKQIAKFFHDDTEMFDDDPVLTALLLKRKRIIHKAVNKLVKFKEIINDLYREKGNLKYTMIYAPEDVCPDDSYYNVVDDRDEIDDSGDEIPLINLYTMLVAETNKYTTVEQFTARETDRDRILRDFAKGVTDVLVAMKCLDEGVDVPRAENAIFCASTGNPRQFIQRRGRILRIHKDKSMANIHDLVVVPYVDYDIESFNMERSLLKRELQRVSDFAKIATNSSHTENVLKDIIEYYELNLYEHE